MSTPTAAAIAPVTYQNIPVTTGFQIVKAGSGQINVYNGDILNVLLVSRSPTPVLSNSLPVQPLTNATLDGTYAYYASAQSGTIATVTVSASAQLSPSPAQIAQQIQALGLATATNQTTQIGAAGTTNNYLGGTTPGALISGAGRTVAGETAALVASGVVTGPPGGSPLLRFTQNLGKGTGTSPAPGGAPTALITNAAINQPSIECEFTAHFSAGLGTSPFIQLVFVWSDSASTFTTWTDYFYIPGGSGAANAITCYIYGPCYANTLSVNAINTDATAGCALDNWVISQTSHIYLDTVIKQAFFTSVNGFLNPDGFPASGILCSAAPSVAFGTSTTRLLPVWGGKVGINLDNLGGASAHRYRLLDPTGTLYSAANNNKNLFGATVNAGADLFVEAVLPQGPVALELHNSGASGTEAVNAVITRIDYLCLLPRRLLRPLPERFSVAIALLPTLTGRFKRQSERPNQIQLSRGLPVRPADGRVTYAGSISFRPPRMLYRKRRFRRDRTGERKDQTVKRILLAIAFIIAIVVPSVFMIGQNANAAPRVPTTAPAVQICNIDTTQLCFNRQYGGRAQGDFIIGWNINDSNNAFELEHITSACGNGGYVTHTCPFTNTVIDNFFYASAIVQLASYDTGYCAGTGAANTYTLRLEVCPNSGTPGWNTSYVSPGFNSGGNPDWLVSIHDTNAFGSNNHWYDVQPTNKGGGLLIGTGTDQFCTAPKCWGEVYR